MIATLGIATPAVTVMAMSLMAVRAAARPGLGALLAALAVTAMSMSASPLRGTLG